MKDIRCLYQVAAIFLIVLSIPTNEAAASQSSIGNRAMDVSTLKKLSLEDLANIKVTSQSKQPVELSRIPAAMYVITEDDIQRSGVTTIADALRLAPGVEVARIDANQWAVGIRGFGTRLSRSVLVLMDGRTVYAPLFAGTYWQVQDTLLHDIDRIEVIRGPGGTIWGPNAVNGVINIITKNTKDTVGSFAHAGGGNEEQGFLSERYGAENGNTLQYRVYGKTFNRAPEYHWDGNNFDRWRSAQVGFRADWVTHSGDNVTLEGDVYDMRAGESVIANTYAPPFAEILNQSGRFSGGNVLARWTRNYSSNSDVQIQAYYDRTNHWEPNFAEDRDTVDVDFVQHLPAGSRHNVTWGLEGRASPSRTSEVISGLVFMPKDRVDQLFSAFIQDEIELIENRVYLTAGSKLLHTDFTGFDAEPSARLLWTTSDRQTFWTAVTHAVRTPSRAEEDMQLLGFGGIVNGQPLFGRFTGNKNFQPEQLNAYELGYRTSMVSNFSIDLATFYNHYHNLLGEDLTGPPFVESSPQPQHVIVPGQFVNVVRGITKGIEIAPDWKPAERWRLNGSYSYLHMNLTQPATALDKTTAPTTARSSPQHVLVGESFLDLPRSFQFNAVVRYESDLPALAIGGYATADANVVWSHNHLALSLVGQNLFQPHHAEFNADVGGPVGIRRSIYGQIAWTK